MKYVVLLELWLVPAMSNEYTITSKLLIRKTIYGDSLKDVEELFDKYRYKTIDISVAGSPAEKFFIYDVKLKRIFSSFGGEDDS